MLRRTTVAHPLTPALATPNPDYADGVREMFARQTIMTTIGARLERIAPGEVDVALAYRADLCQQDGFLHAAIVSAIVDSACGFAAYTCMPPGMGVLSVEFKVNFVAPARGARFLARARVLKPGRTITLTTGEVVALGDADGEEKLVAVMQATMMAVAR